MRNSIRFPHMLKTRVLRDLPDDFKVRFVDECSVRVFESPTEVLSQGGPAHGMFLIAHGSVEITCVNPDGQSVMIHLAGQGETIGDVEAISENACAANCIASPQTTLLYCPKPLLYDCLRSVVFLRNIAGIFYDRLVRDNQSKFVDQFYAVDQRLCAYLHRMSADKPEIAKTQADLAGLLGCARQTLNRELGRLRDRNIIEMTKGKIRVTDRAALLAGAGHMDGTQPRRVN